VGDRIEAKVTLFNKVSGKLLLSIKDMESDEQEAHIYSPADTGGNTLASISGEFLESFAAAQKENNKE